jgi:hypothetical protein
MLNKPGCVGVIGRRQHAEGGKEVCRSLWSAVEVLCWMNVLHNVVNGAQLSGSGGGLRGILYADPLDSKANLQNSPVLTSCLEVVFFLIQASWALLGHNGMENCELTCQKAFL